jgi:hypothetical protein
VMVLGSLFRGKFLDSLKAVYASGKLLLPPGDPREPTDPEAFDQLVDRLYRTDWVVYAKRPFGGPEKVLRYLGRYTHRVGISNQRLIRMDDEGVTFRTKEGKQVTLKPPVFLARFLQHVLPSGFVKIRHYGLMASSNATTKLETARARLEEAAPARATAACSPAASDDGAAPFEIALLALMGLDVRRCPRCLARTMVRKPLPLLPLPLARAPPVAA